MFSAPSADEIEVSIFGPGYGECILVHVGENEWFIVDSCINPFQKELPVLNYLSQIGINPSEAVKLVVASHWHDDHIRGISRIIEICKSAQFVFAEALRQKEFLTLISAYGTRSMMESSGVQEFYDALKLSLKRKDSVRLASADKCLWRKGYRDSKLTWSCNLHALSPSDKVSLLAKIELAKFLPQEFTPKYRIPSQTPNHLAVVLWVSVGDISILLGSDLEELTGSDTGWTLIVDSKTRPQEKATIFKIPHHGSVTADHPRVWDEMLEKNPLAILTPFGLGDVFLPTMDDAKRICFRTDQAYITALPTMEKRTKRRHKVVEDFIQRTVKEIRPVFSSTGHIRLRTKIESKPATWKVDLFNGAAPLRKL